MSPYTSVALINVSLVALTGFVFWLTRSPWTFLLLLFLASLKVKEETRK